MNTLYICEKPSQARVLAKELGATNQGNCVFTGKDVFVTYGYGHLLTLAMPNHYIGDNTWRIEDLPILPTEWKWVVSQKHREQFDNIGGLLSQADLVVIATDPDEEGEVIGRQIIEAHGYAGKVLRLWASALDSRSLSKALNNLLPLSATEHHYQAGMIRHKLDWLLGMNLSRAYSIISGDTVSIGRVKSQMLSEISRRDSEIESFTSDTILSSHVMLDGYKFYSTFAVTGNEKLPMNGVCISVEDKVVDIAAPSPLTLSGLLIQANKSSGLGLSDGYEAAQLLYEAGVISYPRTSSTALPGNAAAGFAAHHAITLMKDDYPDWADENMRAIFREVQLNGIMQQLGAAKALQRTVIFEFGGKYYKNTSQWATEDNAGWMLCKDEKLNQLIGKPLPMFTIGQKVNAAVEICSTKTMPPDRFSEATLLQMMVDNEIGTEATRINTIADLRKDKVASIDCNGLFKTSSNGKRILSFLPSEICRDMSRIVKNAVFQARRDCSDGRTHLLGATKWLAKVVTHV